MECLIEIIYIQCYLYIKTRIHMIIIIVGMSSIIDLAIFVQPQNFVYTQRMFFKGLTKASICAQQYLIPATKTYFKIFNNTQSCV